MRSFAPAYLGALSFTPLEVAAIAALGEARGRQDLFLRRRPEVLESLRQTAIIESVESSNRLEGITAPRRRIEGVVLRSTTPRNRSEQEIAGYRDALALVHESHADLAFSVRTVRLLHRRICRYLPEPGGRFKSEDNEIVERGADGAVIRVRFRPTPAGETPAAMRALVAGFRDAVLRRRIPPLVAAPLAILDLLCIHPFADGNGRVARLATLLLLYRDGFSVGRYLSLERIFEESKESYYETLRESSRGWHEGAHDAHPWLSYFWGTLLRASTEFEERIGTVADALGGKAGFVRSAILRREAPFTTGDIARECSGVSPDLVRLVVRRLRDEGVIVLRGKGRGARWVRREG